MADEMDDIEDLLEAPYKNLQVNSSSSQTNTQVCFNIL
jgi:hypothetical protein